VSDAPQGPGWWQASDGKFYPPQAPTAPPPPQQSPMAGPQMMGAPPATGMSGCLKAFLIVLAIAFVLGLGSCVVLVVIADDVVDEVEQDLAEEDEREARDIGELDCRTNDTTGFMEAEVPVTNHSSERSNYFIEIVFEAPDGSQIDTALATVSNLEPGQSTTDIAGTAIEAPGDFTCRVVGVERLSDER